MLSFESLNSFDDIFNFVTTRNGVIEGDTYSSFNLGVHSGEAVSRVLERRNMLRETLGIAPGHFILPRQVHGNGIAIVDEHFLKMSSDEQKEAVSQADALITNIPEVCIGVTTADCVPVLLYDPVKKCIAAIHAGWRGTAAIGPSIGYEQFEVGDEVYEAFRSSYSNIDELSARHPVTGKYHIDLWKANHTDLCSAGVVEKHIEIAGLCTKIHNDLFYSARASGLKSGRFVSGIYMRE